MSLKRWVLSVKLDHVTPPVCDLCALSPWTRIERYVSRAAGCRKRDPKNIHVAMLRKASIRCSGGRESSPKGQASLQFGVYADTENRLSLPSRLQD